MRSSSNPRVLYIVYWGAAEPLGQSLVLPAVKRLAALGANLTLVTYEKPADLECEERIDAIKASLEESGIRWIPLKYHKRPRVPATLFDFLNGYVRALLTRLGSRYDIVHARTFIGGLIGLAIAPSLRARFIYHNEGFYPDEQVDGGIWQEGSSAHRIAKSLERAMYNRADGIIALSKRARTEIESLPQVGRKATPVIVVPSCVDLTHFQLSRSRPISSEGTRRFVYSGSVGGRYLLDRIGRFVAVASDEDRPVHLRVLTRTDRMTVDSVLSPTGLSEGNCSVKSVHYSAMPQALANEQVGMAFLKQGLSEHGGSPTKIGEYWATGLPVIATANSGDTDEIIKNERVGVIVKEHTDDAYRQALRELDKLLIDPELSVRCRSAAETHYGLEPACDRQINLYEEINSTAARAASGLRATEAGSGKSTVET